MFLRRQFPRCFVSTMNFCCCCFSVSVVWCSWTFSASLRKSMAFYLFGSVFWICFWQLKGIFPCKMTSAVCECWNDFHFPWKMCRPNGPLEFKCCLISHLNFFFFFELCFRAMAGVLLLLFWLPLYSHGLLGFCMGCEESWSWGRV